MCDIQHGHTCSYSSRVLGIGGGGGAVTARGRTLHWFEAQSGNGHREDRGQGCGREGIRTQNLERAQRSVKKAQLPEAEARLSALHCQSRRDKCLGSHSTGSNLKGFYHLMRKAKMI